MTEIATLWLEPSQNTNVLFVTKESLKLGAFEDSDSLNLTSKFELPINYVSKNILLEI